jgi:hypothetical protein
MPDASTLIGLTQTGDAAHARIFRVRGPAGTLLQRMIVGAVLVTVTIVSLFASRAWARAMPGAVRLVVVTADEPAVTVSPTDAQSVNDRSATRTINLIIGGLTLLGVGMLAATIWTWRATKPLKPQMEGLDLLAQRRWHRASVDTRAAILEDIRAVRGPLPTPDISPSTADLVPGPPMPVAPGSDDTSHGYGDIATVQPAWPSALPGLAPPLLVGPPQLELPSPLVGPSSLHAPPGALRSLDSLRALPSVVAESAPSPWVGPPSVELPSPSPTVLPGSAPPQTVGQPMAGVPRAAPLASGVLGPTGSSESAGSTQADLPLADVRVAELGSEEPFGWTTLPPPAPVGWVDVAESYGGEHG